MEAVQPFHNDEFAWLDVFRPNQRARAMVIHRLQNRLAVVRALQVKLKNVEIIAVRMQWSDVQPCPLLPVILVIIISTYVRDALWAKQLRQSVGDGGLAGGAITYDAQEYRSCVMASPFSPKGLRIPCPNPSEKRGSGGCPPRQCELVPLWGYCLQP